MTDIKAIDIPHKVRAAFAEIDEDGGGKIDAMELRSGLIRLGCEITTQEASQLVSEFDNDGEGTIDEIEFYQSLLKVTGQKVEVEKEDMWAVDEDDEDAIGARKSVVAEALELEAQDSKARARASMSSTAKAFDSLSVKSVFDPIPWPEREAYVRTMSGRDRKAFLAWLKDCEDSTKGQCEAMEKAVVQLKTRNDVQEFMEVIKAGGGKMQILSKLREVAKKKTQKKKADPLNLPSRCDPAMFGWQTEAVTERQRLSFADRKYVSSYVTKAALSPAPDNFGLGEEHRLAFEKGLKECRLRSEAEALIAVLASGGGKRALASKVRQIVAEQHRRGFTVSKTVSSSSDAKKSVSDFSWPAANNAWGMAEEEEEEEEEGEGKGTASESTGKMSPDDVIHLRDFILDCEDIPEEELVAAIKIIPLTRTREEAQTLIDILQNNGGKRALAKHGYELQRKKMHATKEAAAQARAEKKARRAAEAALRRELLAHGQPPPPPPEESVH
eukprot:g1665.t1